MWVKVAEGPALNYDLCRWEDPQLRSNMGSSFPGMVLHFTIKPHSEKYL